MTLEEAAQKFHIRGIPANLVDHFWPFAEPFIKRALDHSAGEFRPLDLRDYCKDRVVQLWLVSENERIIAAITTEIINYPRKRHCRIVTLAGSKAPEWTGLADVIIGEWAKEQQCNAMEAYVRKGYVPVLAKYGYKHKYSAVFKELEI